MSSINLRTLAPTSGSRSWPDVLARLIRGDQLDGETARWAMGEIVGGYASTARIAAFVTALRAKGESAIELSAFVDALLESAVAVRIPGRTVDIAGTGGDGTGAVNVSTMAAIVAAATGEVTVIKHGGRSASSTTGGAADLAEQLGVNLELTPSEAERVAAEVGLVSCSRHASIPGCGTRSTRVVTWASPPSSTSWPR